MDVRVLSLDGGGTWAIIQAMALGDLHGGTTEGHEVLSNYDLVVANSGGSLVLAGLLLNWSPDQIRDLFNDEDTREDIFVKNWGPNPHGNRYDADEKKIGLTSVYRGKNGFSFRSTAFLSDIVEAMHQRQTQGRHTEVVITGFDYDEDRAVFFKSCDGTRTSPGGGRQRMRRHGMEVKCNKVSLVDACHVSSNAPVIYFDDPARVTVDDAPLRGWDGAIGGYNNPVLAGITEALTVFKCLPADIKCLSIGTANVWQPLKGRVSGGASSSKLFKKKVGDSWFTELGKLAKAIVGEPPASASYVAAFMLGHVPPFDMSNFRLIRMNPMIQPVFDENTGEWRCPVWARDAGGNDQIDKFLDLAGLDMDAVDQKEVDMIIGMTNEWLSDNVDNQLIVSSGNVSRKRGFPTYSSAKQAWLNLTTPPS